MNGKSKETSPQVFGLLGESKIMRTTDGVCAGCDFDKDFQCVRPNRSPLLDQAPPICVSFQRGGQKFVSKPGMRSPLNEIFEPLTSKK